MEEVWSLPAKSEGKIMLNTTDSAVDTAKDKPKRFKRFRTVLFNALFYILIIAMLLGAFFFASNSSANKSIFGYRIYSVLTGSMTPVYPTGSLVIVKLTDPENIKVGDDITFYNPGSEQEIWTHRVTQIVTGYGNNGICFRTQGVANSSEDPFVTLGGNVVGVVTFSIPYAGYVLNFMQDNMLVTIVIILLAFALIRLIIVLIKPAPVKPRYGKTEPK